MLLLLTLLLWSLEAVVAIETGKPMEDAETTIIGLVNKRLLDHDHASEPMEDGETTIIGLVNKRLLDHASEPMEDGETVGLVNKRLLDHASVLVESTENDGLENRSTPRRLLGAGDDVKISITSGEFLNGGSYVSYDHRKYFPATNCWNNILSDLCHTAYEGQTLEIKFQSAFVTKLIITNRLDCCQDRADGVVVKVGSTLCGTLSGTKDKYELTCETPILGNTITLKPNSNNDLNLAEIEVYGQLEREISITSGEFLNGGSYYGKYFPATNCWNNILNDLCHTEYEGQTLEIKFQSATVSKLIITNRVDCCQDRADGVVVKVGSTLCGTLSGTKDKYELTCETPIFGNTITLKPNSNNHLNLAEMKVYGKLEPWSIVGDCKVDNGCFMSGGWPSPYADDQKCTITANKDVKITVKNFDTERNYDKLTYAGKQYHGSIAQAYGLEGLQVNTGQTFQWNSDYSHVHAGFKICADHTDGKIIKSKIIGETCKDGAEIKCDVLWVGGWCRWDCDELHYIRELVNYAGFDDPNTLWTIKANDADGDGWDGCHYRCYGGCSACW